tara:strand:+ start:985 stop:1569 length:585 start_codon:yes stop_codon:yes gene_type:complete
VVLHRLQSAFILGYHGCDSSIAAKLLDGHNFKPSQNDYDWLGHGIYFWEANPKRGLDYARELKAKRPEMKIRNPDVVGAVIDLGLCLDLTTLAAVEQVKKAHDKLQSLARLEGSQLPENKSDLRRHLDCLVLETLHTIRSDENEAPLDSVKGVFTEGNPIYATSGFYEKTHIQICVCNPECIKGVFRVPTRFFN